MAIELKERYIVKLKDGTALNVLAESFQECLALYGEENVEEIKKMDYDEVKK